MGNNFVEKYKKRSLLAGLAFIFKGRAKYVTIVLLLLFASVPFVVSSDTMARMLALPPVASALRAMGLGSVLASIDPKYSIDLMRAGMEKSAAEREGESYWNRFMGIVNSALPCGAGCGKDSSLAMIRGGADGYEPEPPGKGKGKGGRPQDEIKGAVDDEARARGENGDAVDMNSMLGDMAGGGAPGEAMGAGSQTSGGSSPYVDRSLISRRGGAGSRMDGAYANAMNKSGEKVPVPGSPKKINSKGMGRASGFSWRNVGYKTRTAKMDVKLGNKKPMFQLAETFGMTGAAVSGRAAFEYQAAYTGSTYDGNDVDAAIMQTGTDVPTTPNTAFAEHLISGANGLNKGAMDCANAGAEENTKMSEAGDKIQKITDTMDFKHPPKCCSHGSVNRWNHKIELMRAYCREMNASADRIAKKCGGGPNLENCNNKFKTIRSCSKWKCFWAQVLMILLIIFTMGGALVVMYLVGVLTGTISWNFAGGFSYNLDALTGSIASGGEKDQKGGGM